MANNIMWTPNIIVDDTPLYIQLANEMAKAIASGELKIGEKLPPQRQLAWHLDINLSTVSKAFQLASERHLISGEVGRGTYVLAQSSEAQLYQLKQSNNEHVIDLSTHIPVKFENDQDLKLTINTLLADNNNHHCFNDYFSNQALKRIQLLAQKWLSTFHYDIQAHHCIATNTAQNALLMTLLTSCSQGDVVLVDEFTFPGMKTVAKQLNLKLYGVKRDEQGITPQGLESAIKATGSKVLVSDPTLQNPTATCMTTTRQSELCRIIKQYQLLFIEEYVVGCLSGEAPISCNMQDNSVLITSFAKAVNPGIRFAVLAGRHPIIDSLNNEIHATTWQMSPLMAEVACQWIESNLASKRLKRQQVEIEKRFRLFKKIFPSRLYQGNTTTCSHVWLATTKNSEQVQSLLHHLGVEVVPSKYFAVTHQFPHFIRVSLSAAPSILQLKVALNIIKNANVIKSISPV